MKEKFTKDGRSNAVLYCNWIICTLRTVGFFLYEEIRDKGLLLLANHRLVKDRRKKTKVAPPLLPFSSFQQDEHTQQILWLLATRSRRKAIHLPLPPTTTGQYYSAAYPFSRLQVFDSSRLILSALGRFKEIPAAVGTRCRRKQKQRRKEKCRQALEAQEP